MREVSRGPRPASLTRNAAAWTRALLDARAEEARDPQKKVTDTVWNRYRQPDVKEALEAMYAGCCCYCDASIGEVAPEHIEHLKPKSKFPELAFEWENLHLSCPRCNTFKSNEYDERNPILDPARDRPLTEHLSYEEPESGHDGMFCKANSERGATTIRHARLDRSKLCRRRLDVYLTTLKVTNLINRDRTHPNVPFVKRALLRKTRRQFGSVIAFAIDVTGIDT